jgi:hypothetical protein
MVMYLIIMEDGGIFSSDNIPDGSKEGCDAGICDLIDIVGDYPMQYYKGEWTPLRNIKES